MWGGKLLSGSNDNTIKVWGTGEGSECEQTLDGHTGGVNSITALGDKLVSGSYDTTEGVGHASGREGVGV